MLTAREWWILLPQPNRTKKSWRVRKAEPSCDHGEVRERLLAEETELPGSTGPEDGEGEP